MLTLKSPLDFHEELRKLYDHGMPAGESTGWPSVDQHFTVATKQWTAVTGAPGSGKSEWLDALMINLIRQGWQVIFFSPENQPHELHVSKHMEKWLGKPFREGPTKRVSEDEYIDASIELSHRMSFITVDQEFAHVPSIDEVIGAASRQIEAWRENGSGQKVALVIDPWNEMSHAIEAHVNETNYVSMALSVIRQFARDWDIHIFLVAHPTKLKKNQDGSYPVASLWDISGSAHFNNKADNGISIYRNYESGETDVHILKVRFKHIGQPGMVTMRYDRITGRYTDPQGSTIRPSLRVIKAGDEPCPI